MEYTKYIIKLLLLIHSIVIWLYDMIFVMFGRIVLVSHAPDSYNIDKQTNLSLYWWFGLEIPEKYSSGLYKITIYDEDGAHYYILNDTWANIRNVKTKSIDWGDIDRYSVTLYKDGDMLEFDLAILDKYVLENMVYPCKFETNLWTITQLLGLDCDKIEIMDMMKNIHVEMDPTKSSIMDIYRLN